jgi:hypothetical protein
MFIHRWYARRYMTPTRPNSLRSLFILPTTTVLALVLHSSPARAQAAQPPAQPAQPAPPSSVPVPSFVPIGETYRFEVSVEGWSTLPSTMMYSDTETVTSGSTSTIVTGTDINFKEQLGLPTQKWAPAFHVVIRPQPKHKIRVDYYPLHYKESATLFASINFSGQTYLAGQTVASTLKWDEWQFGYEYDVLTFERGYIGGVAGMNFYSVSGELSNGSQAAIAGVHIPMPGLGAIARYYATPRVSFVAAYTGYFLPGGDTRTHGHVNDVDLYGTINVSKYVGIQGGYRFFNASHRFDSPVNTGNFTLGGGFLGGTFRY